MANQGEIDLQASVSALQNFAGVVATELQALQTAANNVADDPDAEIEALAQKVNDSIKTIQAAMPPAPPPGTQQPGPAS